MALPILPHKGDEVFHVYGLMDPDTKELRYIGKTKQPLKLRLRHHVNPSRLKKQGHKEAWLRTLACVGKKPEIVSIERFDSEDECYAAEIEWIRVCRASGKRLTNLKDGGSGPRGRMAPRVFRHTEEAKRKIAEASRGRPQSEETRLKRSRSMTGLIRSDETKRKISEKNRGRVRPEHEKQNVSNGLRRAYANGTRKPTIPNDETKRKISDGLKAYFRKLRGE